jgi:SPP1 gp7 family putative phage head morphogenesis protein
MAKTTSEYWKKRFELLEQSQNQMGVQCYAEIEKQFRQVQKQLEGQISAWYGRFADNNKITIAEARKWLNKKELAELKWDINEYIRYGKENAINGTWVKELENASAKYHISRLEALKLHTQQQIEVLCGNQLDTLDNAMRNVYKSGFYKTAYEIQNGFGVGWEFGALDEKQIAKVIKKPWAVDGKNFSERVWTNRTKLINELNNDLVKGIVLGQDPQKTIDTIARKMNVSKNVAGRLVMTEEAYFSSAAQKDSFNELDVEYFEVVATLDSHTSEICQDMDGKHFPMSQWEVGTIAPPFHVWCRTTTVPWFEDDFDMIGERAARDEKGNVYYVPANMTYPEWQKSFVNGDTSGLQKIKPNDTMKANKDSITNGVATTIKEAEQMAGTYANFVSFNGISNIDSVNKLTGTLEHLHNAYPVNKLTEIKTKVSRNGRTWASANHKALYPRNKFMNDPVGSVKSSTVDWIANNNAILKQYEDAVSNLKSTLGKDGGYYDSVTQKNIKNYEKIISEIQERLKYQRANVVYPGKEVQSVITHEYGHVLADQLFGQINHHMANKNFSYSADNELFKKCQLVKKTYQEVITNGDIYNISKYASKDEYEFFAECFTVYDMGIETLPDYVVEMMKEVLR